MTALFVWDLAGQSCKQQSVVCQAAFWVVIVLSRLVLADHLHQTCHPAISSDALAAVYAKAAHQQDHPCRQRDEVSI